jgi:hypothetical protein
MKSFQETNLYCSAGKMSFCALGLLTASYQNVMILRSRRIKPCRYKSYEKGEEEVVANLERNPRIPLIG